MIHRLKTWPGYYWAVVSGKKTFEVRKNDRLFNKGDILILQEYEPGDKAYTGQECEVIVTYVCVLPHMSDFVGMSIEVR
jgi:hypothetical protein